MQRGEVLQVVLRVSRSGHSDHTEAIRLYLSSTYAILKVSNLLSP